MERVVIMSRGGGLDSCTIASRFHFIMRITIRKLIYLKSSVGGGGLLGVSTRLIGVIGGL